MHSVLQEAGNSAAAEKLEGPAEERASSSRFRTVFKICLLVVAVLIALDTTSLVTRNVVTTLITDIDVYLKPLQLRSDATLIVSFSRSQTHTQSYLHALSVDGGPTGLSQCSVFGFDAASRQRRDVSRVVLDTERVSFPTKMSQQSPASDSLQVSVKGTGFTALNEYLKDSKYYQQGSNQMRVHCSIQFTLHLFGFLPLPLHTLDIFRVSANKTADSFTQLSFPLSSTAFDASTTSQQDLDPPSASFERPMLSLTFKDKDSTSRVAASKEATVTSRIVSNTSVEVCKTGSAVEAHENNSFVTVCVGAIFDAAAAKLSYPVNIHTPALSLSLGQLATSTDDELSEETSGWYLNTTSFTLRLDPSRRMALNTNFTISCFVLGDNCTLLYPASSLLGQAATGHSVMKSRFHNAPNFISSLLGRTHVLDYRSFDVLTGDALPVDSHRLLATPAVTKVVPFNQTLQGLQQLGLYKCMRVLMDKTWVPSGGCLKLNSTMFDVSFRLDTWYSPMISANLAAAWTNSRGPMLMYAYANMTFQDILMAQNNITYNERTRSLTESLVVVVDGTDFVRFNGSTNWNSTEFNDHSTTPGSMQAVLSANSKAVSYAQGAFVWNTQNLHVSPIASMLAGSLQLDIKESDSPFPSLPTEVKRGSLAPASRPRARLTGLIFSNVTSPMSWTLKTNNLLFQLNADTTVGLQTSLGVNVAPDGRAADVGVNFQLDVNGKQIIQCKNGVHWRVPQGGASFISVSSNGGLTGGNASTWDAKGNVNFKALPAVASAVAAPPLPMSVSFAVSGTQPQTFYKTMMKYTETQTFDLQFGFYWTGSQTFWNNYRNKYQQYDTAFLYAMESVLSTAMPDGFSLNLGSRNPSNCPFCSGSWYVYSPQYRYYSYELSGYSSTQTIQTYKSYLLIDGISGQLDDIISIIQSVKVSIESGLFTSAVTRAGNAFNINANSTLLLKSVNINSRQGGNYQYLQTQINDKGEFAVTFGANGSYGGSDWNKWYVNVDKSVVRAEGRELGTLAGSVSVDLDKVGSVKIRADEAQNGQRNFLGDAHILWNVDDEMRGYVKVASSGLAPDRAFWNLTGGLNYQPLASAALLSAPERALLPRAFGMSFNLKGANIDSVYRYLDVKQPKLFMCEFTVQFRGLSFSTYRANDAAWNDIISEAAASVMRDSGLPLTASNISVSLLKIDFPYSIPSYIYKPSDKGGVQLRLVLTANRAQTKRNRGTPTLTSRLVCPEFTNQFRMMNLAQFGSVLSDLASASKARLNSSGIQEETNGGYSSGSYPWSYRIQVSLPRKASPFEVTGSGSGAFGGSSWTQWFANVDQSRVAAEGKVLGSVQSQVSMDLDMSGHISAHVKDTSPGSKVFLGINDASWDFADDKHGYLWVSSSGLLVNQSDPLTQWNMTLGMQYFPDGAAPYYPTNRRPGIRFSPVTFIHAPTVQPVRSPAPPTSITSGPAMCYAQPNSTTTIQGCRCDPSCASCGYGYGLSWPNTANKCLTCPDFFALSLLDADGSGLCASVYPAAPLLTNSIGGKYNTLTYNGVIYSTLDDISIDQWTNSQYQYLPVPKGWQVALTDPLFVNNALSKYPWGGGGRAVLMLLDGVTSSSFCTGGSSGGCNGGCSFTSNTQDGATTIKPGCGGHIIISQCRPGSYNDNNALQCTKCPAGKYSQVTGSSSSADCRLCAAGLYSRSGASICQKPSGVCPAGTFFSTDSASGSTQTSDPCQLCLAGKYSIQKGLTSASQCTSCPRGTFNSVPGAASATACIACGTTGPLAATTCKGRSHVYPHLGLFYSTLTDVDVNSQQRVSQTSALPVPLGWQIASSTADVRLNVVRTNYWSTDLLVLSNGNAVVTRSSYQSKMTGSIYGVSALRATRFVTNANSTVRLLLGATNHEGRVEILNPNSGVWGTVGSSGWSDASSQVVCAELGLGPLVSTRYNSYYGKSNGVEYSGLQCKGSETSLLSCWVWGAWYVQSSGNNYNDVGVLCTSDSTKATSSKPVYIPVGNYDGQKQVLIATCPPGSFGNTNSTCTLCSSGTFSSDIAATSNTTCSSCPVGSTSLAGASACTYTYTTCPPGFYGVSSSKSCLPCAAGSYSASAGLSRCTSCAPGSYSPIAASTACSICPAGSFTGATNCFGRSNVLVTGGAYYSTLGDVPVDANSISCQAVYLSIPSGWSIAPHTYSIISKVVTQHYWSTPALVLVDGAAFLTKAGFDSTYSNSQGEVYNSQDLSVSGIQYMPTTCNSQILLTLCGPGFWSSGNATCVGCSAGKYSTTVGASSASVCTSCATSKRSAVGAAACSSSCPAGTIASSNACSPSPSVLVPSEVLRTLAAPVPAPVPAQAPRSAPETGKRKYIFDMTLLGNSEQVQKVYSYFYGYSGGGATPNGARRTIDACTTYQVMYGLSWSLYSSQASAYDAAIKAAIRSFFAENNPTFVLSSMVASGHNNYILITYTYFDAAWANYWRMSCQKYSSIFYDGAGYKCYYADPSGSSYSGSSSFVCRYSISTYLSQAASQYNAPGLLEDVLIPDVQTDSDYDYVSLANPNSTAPADAGPRYGFSTLSESIGSSAFEINVGTTGTYIGRSVEEPWVLTMSNARVRVGGSSNRSALSLSRLSTLVDGIDATFSFAPQTNRTDGLFSLTTLKANTYNASFSAGWSKVKDTTHVALSNRLSISNKKLYSAGIGLAWLQTPVAKPVRVPTAPTTAAPSRPSTRPTPKPSTRPSAAPSVVPTVEPTPVPSTARPSPSPTPAPSRRPVPNPSPKPSLTPTVCPSAVSTVAPTAVPSSAPTPSPSSAPTNVPTQRPTLEPTPLPGNPTAFPTTSAPTTLPSPAPSQRPTPIPSQPPTGQPTTTPSNQPSRQPSSRPTGQPSGQPTYEPTSFVNYLSDRVWTRFNASVVANTKDSSGVSFGAFAYKDVFGYTVDGAIVKSATAKSMDGTTNDVTTSLVCPAWRNFAINSLLLPFDNVYFSTVTVSGMSRSFGASTSTTSSTTTSTSTSAGTVSRDFASYNCTSTNAKSGSVTKLVKFFNSRGASDGILRSFACNGLWWRYQNCKSSPVLCVNCNPVAGSICNTVVDTGTCWGSASLPANKTSSPVVFVNPCQDSCKAVQRKSTSSFTVKFGVRVKILYPQFANALVVRNITKTSVTVKSKVDLPGTVSCAPFYSGAMPVSVDDVRSAGFSSQTSDANSVVSVTLSSLQPQTNFSIYCATSDFAGHSMDLSTVLIKGSLTPVSTKCCRAINWVSKTGLQKEADDSTDPSQIFTFSYLLQTPPDKLTTVKHVITQDSSVPGCTFAIPLITPSARAKPTSTLFRPNSGTSYSGSFIVVGTPGCFTVSLVVQSGSTTYQVPDAHKLNLRSKDTQPADPVISSAQFSPNGAAIVVTLDSPTDRGLSYASSVSSSSSASPYTYGFDCSILLSFPGLTRGGTSCYWTSAQQVIAQLSSGSNTVMPGDSLKIRTTLLKPCPPDLSIFRCLSLKYATTNSTAKVTVSPWSNNPTVMLRTAKTIGTCDNVQLDALGSTGSAGRKWASMIWSVSAVSTDPIVIIDSTATSTIASYLNSNYGANNFPRGIDSLVEIPNSLKSTGGQSVLLPGTYTVSLQLTNFLGAFSTGAVSFTIQINWLPQVLIQGASTVVLPDRSYPLLLAGTAAVPACAAQKLNFSLSYGWSVYDGLSSVAIYSSSPDPRTFSIPALTNKLKGGGSYTMRLISAPNTPRLADHTAFAAVTVQVGRAPLNTFIFSSGTAFATTVTQSDVQTSQQPVTLQTALQDFDLADGSYYVASDVNPYFFYGWSCVKTFPYSVYGQDCGLGSNLVNATLRSNNGLDRPFQLQVPVSYVQAVTVPLLTLKFTVSVREAIAGVVKTSSSDFSLSIRSDSVPKLTPSPVKAKYNPSDKIVLDVLVTVIGSATNVTWSTSTSGISLPGVAAISSLSTLLPASSSSLTQLFELPISPNSLQSGSTYSFTLTAFYSRTQVSTTTFNVVMNTPPSGGLVSVLNSKGSNNGTALVTTFLFKTFNWVVESANLPISFTLSTYTVSPLTDLTVLQPLGPASFINTTFPLGLSANGFQRYCQASAQDSFGALATAPNPAVVVVMPPSTANLAIGVAAAITSAMVTADSSALLSASTSAASVINAVNCGFLNETNCNSWYNRHACSGTALTCGACLPGSSSPSGPFDDANTLCYSSATQLSGSGRRLGAANSGVVGSDCGNPDMRGRDCLSGYCYLNICTERPKACPNDCSGRGTCVYYGSASSTTPMSSPCSEFNDLCIARCSCSTGWYGEACNKGATDFTTSKQLIETLCSHANAASLKADVTLGSLLQQATTIKSLLADPTLLSPTSLGNCTQMLVASVTSHPEVVSSSATATQQVLSALHTIISMPGFVKLPVPLLLAAQNATVALMAASQATLGINETPLEMLLGSTRVKTLVMDPKTASSASVAAPLTSYDKGNGKRAATLSSLQTTTTTTTSTSGGSGLTAVGVSLVQFTNSPLNSSTSSLPVTVQLSAYKSVSAAGSIRTASRHLTAVPDDAPEGPLRLVRADVPFDHSRLWTQREHRFRRLSSSLIQSTTYSFTVTLPNTATISSYQRANTTVVTRKCQSVGQVIQVPAGCGRPKSNAYTCSSVGSLKFTCASKTLEPQCVLMSGAGNFVPDTATCKRVAYTNTSTTCACNLMPPSLAPASGSRRLSTTASSAGSITVASTIVQSNSAYSESFVSLPTPAPTTASSTVVVSMAFTLAGLSVADMTGSVVNGIRNATAHLCKPPLDLASVVVTFSASSRRLLGQERDLAAATGVNVVVSVIASPTSPNTNAFSQLSSVTPSVLQAALVKQPALSSFSAAQLQPSGLIVSNVTPTSAPVSASLTSAGTSSFNIVAIIAGVAGAGVALLAFIAFYYFAYRHTQSKVKPDAAATTSISTVEPFVEVVEAVDEDRVEQVRQN